MPRQIHCDNLIRVATRLLFIGIAALNGGCNWVAQNQNLSGVAQFQKGNYQAADQSFRQALQNDPTNPDAYYNLAALEHRIAKTQQLPTAWQQAESYYQQALARDPNHADSYRGLAVLLVEQNRQNDAFALLDRWAQLAPTSADPQLALARLSEEFSDKARAQDYLVNAIRLDPNNSKALAALGKIREEAGDLNQAVANYQRALASNPFQPQVQQRVAALQTQVAPPGFGPNSPGSNGRRYATQPGPYANGPLPANSGQGTQPPPNWR